MNNDVYKINMNDDILKFETTSFKAEKGSVLHSGIYNRELSSALSAGAIIMILGFFFVNRSDITFFHWILALLIFLILFIFFRTYVFLEPLLCVLIDKKNSLIDLSVKRLLGKKQIHLPLSELHGIRQDYVAVVPENPDGIRLVEQVALQHGTIIPGFGKTAEFYTVELEFRDGKRFIIFSSEEHRVVEYIATKFKNFIKE